MPAPSESHLPPDSGNRGGWTHRFFWGKLSRPLTLLALLLLASAVATGYSLFGYARADWVALLLVLAAIGVMLVILRRVRRRLRFVAHLRDWAERMRGGELAAKIPMSREDDLADVIEDINSLGGMLQRLALQADVQSRAQTVRLARKTQSLDILYEVAQSLTLTGTLDQQLTGFLDTFIELVDARAATVHLLDGQGDMRLIASRGPASPITEPAAALATPCDHCGWQVASGALHILTDKLACVRKAPLAAVGDRHEVVVVPVPYQGRVLGVYTLYLDWPASVLGEDALQLLTSIARHLALAIEKARLDNDARRLAIMEERNMIGNELHDSLAQSLVGMRLQVKMLGETLHKKDVRRAQEEARRLRIAVEEAHASLRELLANFRLRIDERGLVPAIESMVRRANQEPGLTVFFHNDCERLSLTPAQEIQVYHIVQEALTNIRKHANARNARIQLGTTSDGRYSMLIEDDGDGIAHTEPEHPGEQIGLAIMRQRAERLPGELTIESEPGEGTRVFLTFSAVNGEIAKQAYGS
jgi:two-component system nitrate/nitrite sensor histidine kinase NarX